MSPRKSSELTEAQRGMILGLRKAGNTYEAIAKEMKGICKISPSTAYRTCQRFKKHSTTKSLPGRGRRPVLSKRMKRLIIRHARINRHLPYSTIANELGGVTAAQVRAVASAAGYHRCIAVHKPFISKAARQKRIQWAEENEERDWDEAMWTDEMKMETGSTSTRQRVTRRPEEKDSLECIAPMFQSGRESFMTWGCVAHDWKGPLIRLKMSARTVNGQGKVVGGGFGSAGYVEQVVSGPLKDSVAKLSKLRGRPILVVEDGAPAHRGKRVDEARKEAGVQRLTHPPSSPDLNPIEPVWRLVKKRVDEIPGSRSNLDALWRATKQVWDELSIDDINKHTGRMSDRVTAVKKAKGLHTPF